jgi:serine/threonine protein kinase
MTGMESWINQEIGQRYLVRALIGEGAHARVYRATDSVRGKDVALKLFHPGTMDAQQAEAAHQFEVWDGSSILPILDVHPDYLEGQITIMPLMEGTLADISPIFASNAIYYARRVLTALEFCHGRGVAHGDVKLSNSFVDSRGACFLGDFGVRDFLAEGVRGHTLEYAAPELIEGSARSPATDVWGVAVMLYEMLTGTLPFGSRAEMADEEVAERIVICKYKHPDAFRPYLPLRARNFFKAAFEPDPANRRLVSAAAMRDALPGLNIRADWVQWRKAGFLTHWEGYQVAAGEKTGVRYLATVQERRRLRRWEAEIKRANPSGSFRCWPGTPSYLGSKKEAVHRMVLWMRNVTQSGSP